MSFDKEYPNRKDKRKPYRGSKAFDRSCRNHGNCKWCERNRKHFDIAHRTKADAQLKELTAVERNHQTFIHQYDER